MDAELLKKISLIAVAVSEKIRSGRTDETDSISPFGFQPGTKKAGKRARPNKPPGKCYVEHFYGHFKEKINKILGADFV